MLHIKWLFGQCSKHPQFSPIHICQMAVAGVFCYLLFQFYDLFGQITYRIGQLIKCYCLFLNTPIVFNCSPAKETGISIV